MEGNYILFDRLHESYFDSKPRMAGLNTKDVVPETEISEKGNPHYPKREQEPKDSVLLLEKEPVMKIWTWGLSWKEQTVLISALRGCDSAPKNDLSKKIIRRIRRVVLNNAGRPGCEFMQGEVTEKELYRFSKNIDAYPVHFLLHLIYASEVIGYLHPDEKEREFFHGFYQRMVKAFHMNPETKEEMRERLKDGVNTDCHKT